MGIVDAAVIAATLRTRSELRGTLRELLQRLSGDAFALREVERVERELIRTLRLTEARRLPVRVPRADRPLQLSAGQWDLIIKIVARFEDVAIRKKCQTALSHAVAQGVILAA